MPELICHVWSLLFIPQIATIDTFLSNKIVAMLVATPQTITSGVPTLVNIELGCWPRLPHAQRLCPYGHIQDEPHILCDCLLTCGYLRRKTHGPHVEHCCIPQCVALTHWGRVTHICVGNLTIIGSDNGLSPVGAKPLSEPMLEYC